MSILRGALFGGIAFAFLHGNAALANNYPDCSPIPDAQKPGDRQYMEPQFRSAVANIQKNWVLTNPPYLDGPFRGENGMPENRYLKAWWLWEPDDFQKFDHRLVQVLVDMAELDDWADLQQIMPQYFAKQDGVRGFAAAVMYAADLRHDIHCSHQA